MLRMSKLTDYGTVVLVCLATSSDKPHSAAEVAGRTRLAQPTVSKLLKVLARAGLVNSCRGAQGGYSLSRGADAITAAEILDALEGPVAITECSSRDSQCELEPICSVGHVWQRINREIRRALEGITLDQLAGQGTAKISAMDISQAFSAPRPH